MKQKGKRIVFLVSLVLFLSGAILLYHHLSPSSLSRLDKNTIKWDGSTSLEFSGGNGTIENPYIITSGADIAFLKMKSDEDKSFLEKHYALEADINIDNNEFPSFDEFTGSIDGRGHTIANIKLNKSIFHSLNGATIKDINLENIDVENVNTNILANSMYDVNLSNITVINANGNLSDSITNSEINRVYFNTNIDDGFIISKDIKDTKIDYLVVKGIIKNEYSNLISEDKLKGDNIYYFSKENEIKDLSDKNIAIEKLIETLNDGDNDFVWQNYSNNLVYEVLNKELYVDEEESSLESSNPEEHIESTESNASVNESIKKTIKKGATLRAAAITEHASGVDGTTVYVNDLIADYNYYKGQNYTYSSNMTTPTMENKNIYNDTNLVKTMVTYNGVNRGYTGTISLTENQNKIVYYKYFEVNDNGTSSDKSDDYILIELLDSPFSNRPNNKAFHGWKTSYSGSTVYLDSAIYVRFAKVPVTYSGENPQDIEITFDAIWDEATTYSMIASTDWETVNNNLKAKSMQALDITEIIVANSTLPSGYFTYGGYTTYLQRYTGYDVNGTYRSNYRCNSFFGCTYYNSAQGTTYNEDTTYYKLNGNANQVTQATLLDDGVLAYAVISEYQNEDMTGYFVRETIPNGSSYAGYYNSTGTYQTSGTCSTSGGCTYYKMLQADDNNIANKDTTYYYMVTRDTNIVVATRMIRSGWSSSNTKPFTLTSVNNGTNYRNTNSAGWDVDYDSTYDYVKAYSDIAIENIYISSGEAFSSTTISTSTTQAHYFYGNFHNVKLGRGITSASSSTLSFVGILGGNNSYSDLGSAANPKRYRMIVESGIYNIGGSANGVRNTDYTMYLDESTIFGSDIDRVKKDNTKLNFGNVFSPNWNGVTHSSDDIKPAYTTIYKSGNFGSQNYDYMSGIYAGARGYGNLYGPAVATIEGGIFRNVIGSAVQPESDEGKNKVFINIKGGTIDNINGGAGHSETHGNRIISVTGGTINYSIFGGSNAYNSTADADGILRGDSFIYVGGNATVGSETNVNNNTTLWDAEAGSIFGNGDGNNQYPSMGSNNNAYIIIADEAHILRNVYGGGNYGATGIVTNEDDSENRINIIGGTIDGSVYGGGNQNGGGTTNKPSNSFITMDNGLVKGSIYGGSNVKGIVYGNSTINVNGGTINGSVYGGGQGGYDDDNDPGTYVAGNILINIGDTNKSTTPRINTSVYGGSAYGAVCTAVHSDAKTDKTLTLNINKGKVVNSVFGGGQGSAQYTPIVACDVTVNMNNGNIGNIYGANDAAGIPSGDLLVNLNGGTANNVYGGGNNTGANETNVIVNNGTFNEIYGGSNQSGTVTESNVTFNGGTVNAVYGGNNAGGEVTTTNVTVNSGSLPNVYGGGNNAVSSTTNLEIAGGTVTSAFGGGNNAEATTTNVSITGGTTTNVFGSGNNAGSTSTNVIASAGTITNIYGGANQSGAVSESNITVNSQPTITNIYGGNNLGGTTSETNITINNGNITNVYGGGNEAETHYNNVTVSGGVISGSLYGGGNKSTTTNDVVVNVTNATLGNAYGGGNIGNVNGNVLVNVTNANINSSLYGGGNQANVLGNVNLNVGGTTSVQGNVFGGGNHGAIGSSSSNKTATVNIKGGTITGNVYGGCNTSVVYGNTVVNIGKNDSVNIASGDVSIAGTVFGGGEANASGSEVYDFSFISVTNGIDINIDGTGYNNFALNGSIFGSGNASSSAGESIIYIKNLGTRANPNVNVSIQRANKVTLDNSVIELLGATDRTNEYSNIKYSLNRIDDLILKNDAVLLLQKNANLLKKFTSVTASNQKAAVTIDEHGNTTRNVDNRLYLLAGTKLNILTTESLTDYGQVSGMTFMGMYTKSGSGSYQYGLYEQSVSNGDAADAGDIIIGTSYVLGAHKDNHDITVDGYYTNYIDDAYTKVETKYIEPTPEDSNYYMWTIGAGATEYTVDLTAAKYSSLGAKELSMIDYAQGDVIFNVLGFNSEGLSSSIDLINPDEVPNISRNINIANSKLGLAMRSETSEWTSYNDSYFTEENNGKVYGDTSYQTDSQKLAPSLMFYLYHAKNMSLDEELGSVVITLEALVPKNEIEYEPHLITITVNITAVNYDDGNAYDASIAYGKKYTMPSSTNVNITNKSQFTAYFGLYGEAENFEEMYGNSNQNYHTLVSSYSLPVGTKITMIDTSVDNRYPEEYYYIIDQNDYQDANNQLATKGEIEYRLSKFIKMNSIDSNNVYNDAINNHRYYIDEDNYTFEEYLFIIDLQNTNINTDALNNSLLFELRQAGRTVVSTLGIRQQLMNYNLYNSESTIALSETVEFDSDYIYSGTETDVNYSSRVNYNENDNNQTVIDTNYETSNMGLNISFYDSSGTLISSSLLEDTSISISGKTYHTDSRGVFRIRLAGKVSNLDRIVKMHIGNTLPTGTYTIEYKLFASEDGLYSDGTKDVIVTKTVTLIGTENAINVTDEQDKEITDKVDTGRHIQYVLNYESELQEPNLRISVYKRDTSSFDSIVYNEIDPTSVFSNSFTNPAVYSYTPNETHEKMLTNSPQSSMTFNYTIRDNVQTGTYKISFKLCNNNHIVDTVDKYIIIKTVP